MASCCKHRLPSSSPCSGIPTRGLPILPLALSLQDFYKKVAGIQEPEVGHLLTTGRSFSGPQATPSWWQDAALCIQRARWGWQKKWCPSHPEPQRALQQLRKLRVETHRQTDRHTDAHGDGEPLPSRQDLDCTKAEQAQDLVIFPPLPTSRKKSFLFSLVEEETGLGQTEGYGFLLAGELGGYEGAVSLSYTPGICTSTGNGTGCLSLY